ncbi:MAG TPA: ATP-binding cassette domain-containing protein, partial [Micromonosporaceae bacterium]|nr:ATP-binding cassette domain-containing protein [Micromonosporaceae bacterium]
MTPLLRVTDLTVAYRRAPGDPDTALDAVSLDVPRGQVTAVIGESGSGKSTLAHAVVRLLPRTGQVLGGRIEFAGEDVLRRDDRSFRALRGRHIGFVPQDPIASLNPTKTVGAQLREAFTLARSPLPPAEVDAR